VGVHAIKGLAGAGGLPEGIGLLDVGVLGLDILVWNAPDEPVVILDAVTRVLREWAEGE
jgi:Ni,Fe-hydrogenase maturation factor